MSNGYIDNTCQKAGVPGFPGCVKHVIQRAKKEKGDLYIVCLDLSNAYGSVHHQLIMFALDFFYVPGAIKDLITGYF